MPVEAVPDLPEPKKKTILVRVEEWTGWFEASATPAGLKAHNGVTTFEMYEHEKLSDLTVMAVPNSGKVVQVPNPENKKKPLQVSVGLHLFRAVLVSETDTPPEVQKVTGAPPLTPKKRVIMPGE